MRHKRRRVDQWEDLRRAAERQAIRADALRRYAKFRDGRPLLCHPPAAAVQADQTDTGWQCSVCGWATVDLGTMHEQLWRTTSSVDMVCPGCGAEGAFVGYDGCVH